MPQYSVIIPVYNRPAELQKLLDSLAVQRQGDFEVIVVDDGSQSKSDEVSAAYHPRLDLHYFYIANAGPGQARNYGCMQANTDFFIFFDSDCIVPPDYFQEMKKAMANRPFDAYGGPDREHADFTPIQKAISYSMTSAITTGGIRGGRQSLEKFHPRSFNMGISRAVFEATGGFSTMRFGEDIDLSIRIMAGGFKAILLPECFVYHERRTDLKKFFKQVFNSGIARINLYKRHPQSMRLVHALPALFVLYLLMATLAAVWMKELVFLLPLGIFLGFILLQSAIRLRSLRVALLAMVAALVQMTGYGLGFMLGVWRRMILGKDEFHAFGKNFYK
jgi:glycosyltransferase involved in cell wall biosynthesis